jgi:hypothetical protein
MRWVKRLLSRELTMLKPSIKGTVPRLNKNMESAPAQKHLARHRPELRDICDDQIGRARLRFNQEAATDNPTDDAAYPAQGGKMPLRATPSDPPGHEHS